MANTMIVLLFLLAFIAGTVVLQIFLSRRESKWAGLILPFISFGFSLLTVLAIILFTAHTGTTISTVDGEAVGQVITTQIAPASLIIVSAIYIFLLSNIPTGILLAIYAACRSGRKKRLALDKMSVQDL